jgi:hypothetical protein
METMIERVHEHLLDELTNNARTDTVFVITAILLNLIVLAINSTIAASGSNGNSSGTRTIIMVTFTVLVIVVNLVAEIGLIRGRQMRRKLLNGLLKMYQDQGVAGYYDPSLLSDYRTRYDLFLLAVLVTGLVSIIIPFIIR